MGNIHNINSCILDPGAFGVRALGMGGAVVSSPVDLISAFYYNPAGLTRIKGSNFTSGIFYLYLPSNYEHPSGYDETNTLNPLVPYIGFSTDKTGPLTLGLCTYSTLGSGFEFKKDPEHGFNHNIKSIVGVLSLNPTVAYKIRSDLSVGVELNIGYGVSEMNTPTPFGYLKSDADGFGFGSTVGLLYQPFPSLNLGLSWRSPMKTPLKGDARIGRIKDDMDMDLYWPQMLSWGISYKFKEGILFSLALKWSDWSYFDHSKSKYKRLKIFNRSVVQGTKDGIRYQIGMEYLAGRNTLLRCGYIYDPYSIKSEWVSPMLPDQRAHEICIGIGKKFDNFQFDMACNYGIFIERKITKSQMGYNGKYKGNRIGIGIEMTYHF
ncbi:MAG: outer membrane protein transport protein [Thermodesulfobacteriota bacterium]|nr:outer membrane protein transport protein [Thermodesulfobacteriota bacterium]